MPIKYHTYKICIYISSNTHPFISVLHNVFVHIDFFVLEFLGVTDYEVQRLLVSFLKLIIINFDYFH